ncbi:SsgA family sporulation/cell division regulator [Streptosporangium sandarakinum]|uniref:SsgA family sporulation/cell division regulator n=1 Tax=Streptosporangium sandarakinum TaxID=1260955 RepID=UPI0033B757EE
MSAREITKGITLWPTDRPDYPLAAVLSYRMSDPYAVRLSFVQGRRETVVYGFARMLLAAGLLDRAGEGDVTVAPHEEVDDYLVLTVTPEHGYPFPLYVQREAVQDFLDRSFGLVPLGREHEHLDVDAAITALLREVSS